MRNGGWQAPLKIAKGFEICEGWRRIETVSGVS
jgi:hypothetical protein